MSAAQTSWMTEGQILHVSCKRESYYRVMHPVRPMLDLQEHALAEMVDGRPVLLVVDKNVWRLFEPQLSAYSNRHLKCLSTVLIEATEQGKNWSQVRRICSHAIKVGVPRHGIVVAFGGGVTLDLAGMAASLFRRGVDYLPVPTTLIGMVDTGVGIKQGFNFGCRKNILGTFYPPIGVINDFTFLRTLTEKEFSCGIAEIIKIAVIRDGTLIPMLERNGSLLLRSRFQHPTDLVLEILLRAERAMIDELQPNLFETRRARLADFGHTFSQGLERVSGYKMRHGHAVALGMLLSTGVAVGRKLCSSTIFERLVRLYRAMGLPITSPLLQPDLLLASIHEARLHRAGDLNLVVPLDFGRAEYLQELDPEELVHSLALMEEAADEPQLPAVAGAGV